MFGKNREIRTTDNLFGETDNMFGKGQQQLSGLTDGVSGSTLR